ncbi:hypothetical protein FPQ18DRAFT_74625 [Pyronema domesticum]|nr:hypothetical protein FPQ18DRAFT_74625 [Pyronema domesticum]
MSPTAPPQPAQASFHRFRLSDFQRPGNPTSSPAGQCSRFRVSDFVPYGSTTSDASNQSGPQINGSHSISTSNTGTQRSNHQNRQQNIPGAAGSYQVLHMDIEVSPPHHTSNQVAAAGGRGVLHKVPIQKVPAAQLQNHPPPPPLNVANNQQRPIVPAPPPSTVPPIPAPPPAAQPQFTPSDHTEEVRNELSRIVTNIRAAPMAFTELVVNALFAAPSLTENSLLRQIGALYPIPQVAPPVPIPVPPQGTESETPVKRKRGRPPTRKHAAASDLTAAPQPASNNMGSPLITIIPARKDKDTLQTCTRCLKPFNPSGRPAPSSDPNHEATCAVRHPYSDYRSGLVTSLTLRGKRSSMKPTWRWKCCGREIQSTSDDPNIQFPREEDDKTGGWCFVGKHTTEPGVREKLGLKQGKGKTIDEVADIGSDIINGEGGPARKRTKLNNTDHAVNNNNVDHAVQSQQHPEERGPSISIPGNTTAAESSGNTTTATGPARPAVATRRRTQIPADVHQNWMPVVQSVQSVQPVQHAHPVSVQPQPQPTAGEPAHPGEPGKPVQHAQHAQHALTTTISPIATHHHQSPPMPPAIIPKLADTTETAETATPMKRKRGRPKGKSEYQFKSPEST